MIDSSSSYSIQPEAGNKKKTTMIIVVIIIILALVGGYFIFRPTQNKDKSGTPVVEKTSPTPTPTEKPKINKESVKIQVLNGTGTPGQAGIAVEALTKAGYKAENIKTGNAEEFDNTTTTISAKKGFEDVAIDIKDSLKSTFDDVKVDSTELDGDSEFDIVVTTGGKIFEETTSTPTPKPTLSSSSPTPASTSETPTPTLTPTLTPTPTP